MIVELPKVRTAGAAAPMEETGEARFCVFVPSMTSELPSAANDNVVPECVIWPPGVSV